MHLRARLWLLCLLPTAFQLLPESAWASVAQVHGHAGLVGDYQTDLGASKLSYQAIRFPLSLTLEAKPSSRVSLFVQLSPSFNLFPDQAQALGNNAGVDFSSRQTGNETYQPLSAESRPAEILRSSFAYLAFSSDLGLLTIGRVPRHWGLGIWRNAEWRPDSGRISTSDLVSLTLDFSASLSGSLYYEKVNEGLPTSVKDDAEAFTVEALLADDPRDPSASGFAKRIGIAFSSYGHGRTDTELSILDMFGQFYFSQFLLESELLYPTGKTRSLKYGQFGGETEKCADIRNPSGDDLACESRQVESFAAILRSRYVFSGGGTSSEKSWSSVASVDAARESVATSLTPESHEMGAELGFARGDRDAFRGQAKDGSITGVPFHPNIRPNLLMFSPVLPLDPGMPGALVQNVLYIKGHYAYETPGFGMIMPSLTWASLHQTAPSEALNTPGTSADLGVEFDLTYRYRTLSRVDFDLTAGALFAGDAYRVKTENEEKSASVSYGLQTVISTRF